jgi:hypothetical protein
MAAGDDSAHRAARTTSELHQLAKARPRELDRRVTLDTTDLMHETYLRFVRVGELRGEDRRAFFAYASQVMRSVILNNVCDRAPAATSQMRQSVTTLREATRGLTICHHPSSVDSR